MRRTDGSGATPRAKLESQITSDWTVEGLFAGLERDASADPLEHYYRVEFDALMGFPRKINNGLRNAYDAEWMVEVLQVVRLDCAGCRDNGSGRPTGRESPAGR